MKRIVVSKQCDNDSDLALLWHHWYRRVFGADLLVITPVKTDSSSILETVAFWEGRADALVPIEMPRWNEAAVWEAQKAIAARLLPADDFFVLAADADEFFDRVEDGVGPGPVVFHQQRLISEDTALEPGSIAHARIHAWPAARRGYRFFLHDGLNKAGCRDRSLDGLDLAGHTARAAPAGRVYYHLYLRGFDRFLAKLDSIEFRLEDLACAHDYHWKVPMLLRSLGDGEAMRVEYARLLERARAGTRRRTVRPFVERFA